MFMGQIEWKQEVDKIGTGKGINVGPEVDKSETGNSWIAGSKEEEELFQPKAYKQG